MKLNPPCYRCDTTTPLPDGRIGLCARCAGEVDAERNRPPAQATCPGCGHFFVDDWERIQHTVNKRHNYRSWTETDGKRMQDVAASRRAPV